MSVPDRSIDPRLLSAAREVFLKKGYEMASLAEICETANVTTGALYKRFSGKEELFAEVVSDTVRAMEDYVSPLGEADLTELTNQELYDGFSMNADAITGWLKFLSDHKEGFTLLIKCAGGTRYADFHHEWSEKMNEVIYKYYVELKRRGMTVLKISREEMHVMTAALWAMFYEPFIHDFTWEQMMKHAETMSRFIDWHSALGTKQI